MLVQTKLQTYTPEDYFALEEQSETKHEYHNGEILPMTGGTTDHNRIIINLVAFLKFAFRNKPLSFFASDVRLWLPDYNRYTYPDLQIISGDIMYYENRKDTVTKPSVIVEVLSNSTRSYDKGDKFKYYRSLPTFQEYITIDQYRFEVEHYVKTDDCKWLVTYLESEDSVLSLTSVDFELSLKDLYEDVNFSEAD